jgi:hypothetical protein
MKTETYPTFETVAEMFERVCQQLREDNQENAPNSCTWFARTKEELVEVAPVSDHTESTGILGDVDAPIVAWVFECNGHNLTEIHEGASDTELLHLFSINMGYDVWHPRPRTAKGATRG